MAGRSPLHYEHLDCVQLTCRRRDEPDGQVSALHLRFVQAMLGAADEGVVQVQCKCLPLGAGLLGREQRSSVLLHHRGKVLQA